MRTALILVTAFLLSLAHGKASAQDTISINKLMNETQIISEAANDLTLVWWIPIQYWQASFAQDASVTEEQAEEIISMLEPYTVVGVVDGTVGPLGGVTYEPEEAVRGIVTATDLDGQTFVPLDSAEVDPNMVNLFEIMKPVLTNIVGPMGQNMHFLVFQSDGAPIVDPVSDGLFKVAVGDDDFSYRLPLGSILPPKRDPDTGEEFPGNYSFNPFTGTALVAQ